MDITGVPSRISFNRDNSPFENPTTGRVNGRLSRGIAGVAKTMHPIPLDTETTPVQQRSLTRADNYMPFFRVSDPETTPAPLLEAPTFAPMSPDFDRYDITINDPEFRTPEVKPKTLATIIKTYINSFRNMSSVNTPLIDRSDRVEKLRHRFFGVLQLVLESAVATALLVAGFKVSVIIFSILSATPMFKDPLGWLTYAMIEGLIAFFVGCLIALGNVLTIFVTYPITAAVAAGLDTYEKLSQGNETPEEKFMNKYQRMEKQLAYLKEIYHHVLPEESGHAAPCRGSDSPMAKALRRADIWCEKTMLRFLYDKQELRQELDEAILKIEYWLENAKKQKDLISNSVEMAILHHPSHCLEEPPPVSAMLSDRLPAIVPVVRESQS